MTDFLAWIGMGKKVGGGNRRDFVRTKISLGEKLSSVVILFLLVGLGIAIAIKGQHFDPYLYTVRTDSLDATAAPVVGKSQTLSSPSSVAAVPQNAAPQEANPVDPQEAASKTSTDGAQAESGADNSSAPTAAAATGAAMEIALPGIKPMSDTEFYTSDTLYEKIDGRSPAYQNFNVQGLRCRTFSVLAAAGSFVDVYEYRFDSPLDAFGMYAVERDPKGKPTDFVTDGYSGEMGYFFRQGPVYVQIIASDEKPETMAVATALAQNRAKELPVDDTGIAGRRQLPATGLVPDSVSFVPDNAQGMSALQNVFQAKYNFEGANLPFFVMVASPNDVNKAWNSLQDFCKRFGKNELLPDVNGGKVFRTQIFGKWKVVYLRDKELGGVFDATDADKASTFVEQYLQGKIK